MTDIINKMKEEIINRSNIFEMKTKGTKDQYKLYREHIQFVYKYADLISASIEVDKEVILLSALLHDISMTDATLDRTNHNEYSSEIATKLLLDNGYLIMLK